MSDTMLLGVLRMPFDIAMATLTAQIQYHQRGVQAADEIEKRTRQRDEARAVISTLEIVGKAADDERAQLRAEVERLQGLLKGFSRDMAEEIERLRAGKDLDTSSLALLRQEIKGLARERDEARAWAAKLLATLEMVRDADNDCRVEGWATIPDVARQSIDQALKVKP